MILLINNEIKIQGKPEECIEFLKKYNEEFKDNEPVNILDKELKPLDDFLHNYTPPKTPDIIYTNRGCDDCLYYQQMKNNPRFPIGDTPCTWCDRMRPYCESSGDR